MAPPVRVHLKDNNSHTHSNNIITCICNSIQQEISSLAIKVVHNLVVGVEAAVAVDRTGAAGAARSLGRRLKQA